MRESLLEILKCPKCNRNSFYLEKDVCVQSEIKKGRIVCKDCQASYHIADGIVNFLNGAPETVLRERKAMDEDEYITDRDGKRYRITDQTIERFKEQFLSLPEGDVSHFFKRGGSFQSIAEGSSRFYSTFSELALTGKESILEIGACFSYASFNFAKRGCKVVAMDISNYLKVANLFTETAYFDRIFSDMHQLPFIDNRFDIVFGSAILHHSKNLVNVFREIYRVLKPGGKLVLINESARGLFEKIHPVFEEMDRKGFGDTSYTMPEWKKAAYGGGFRDVRIELLPLTNDYIMRHKNRGSADSFKLRFAYFIKKHRNIEKLLLFLLMPLRVLFRPKSWRLICYKEDV